jgi:O-acetyl-ADP-ribose deacetylase (regulator of RNase III)
LEYGILSHQIIENEKIKFTPIYDAQIVANRHNIKTPDGKSLWEFANLYFQPRNPMLYRVISEKSVNDVIVISIKGYVLNRNDIFISTGNAAHSKSDILPVKKMGDFSKIAKIIKSDINKIWWKEADGSKRKIMAECLVPNNVMPDSIDTIYVANHDVAEKLKYLIKKSNISVIPEPSMFFQNPYKSVITDNLSLVEGDMFFSRMHTLTISVNVVGIMGKGLASRTKYQFPEIYVKYQDLCRERILKMGKPYLYKSEISLDYELADEPSTMSNMNLETWFLLFPTKKHWREHSDIQSIEEGLKWLKNNYKKEGIKSLAIPALGCGLGWLDWRNVGPLICKYLATFDIPVSLYLPAEKKIQEEFLKKEFLLAKGN